MKKVYNYVLIGIIVLMTVLTSLFSFKEGAILRLLNGSVESTTKYFASNCLIPLFLVIACVFSLILYFNRKKYSFFFLLTFSLIWLLSGRTIGVHHTGELSVGWFNIETNKVVLWEADKCLGNVLGSTTFKQESLLMVRYGNTCKNGRIFTGPLIASDIEQYFK